MPIWRMKPNRRWKGCWGSTIMPEMVGHISYRASIRTQSRSRCRGGPAGKVYYRRRASFLILMKYPLTPSGIRPRNSSTRWGSSLTWTHVHRASKLCPGIRLADIWLKKTTVWRPIGATRFVGWILPMDCGGTWTSGSRNSSLIEMGSLYCRISRRPDGGIYWRRARMSWCSWSRKSISRMVGRPRRVGRIPLDQRWSR